MRFRDRREAGRQLAEALKRYGGQEGVVYPLPRGGVVLGAEIARVLGMPLDLIIPRKIGHPFNEEYAVCAVTETGEPVCNELEVGRIDHAWLEAKIKDARQEARRRRELYLAGRPVPGVEGKVAILVDDGIATGLTMRAAMRDARQRRPKTLVVAVPVAPSDTVEMLRAEVDDVVTLDVPDFYLGAVGAYYLDFPQLSDAEVISLLA